MTNIQSKYLDLHNLTATSLELQHKHYEFLSTKPQSLSEHITSGMFVLAKLLQLCPTLHNPMDCSPPGSSVHGILQARILEGVTISSSRGSSPPRNQTCISYASSLAGGSFNISATWEALLQATATKSVHLTVKEKNTYLFCACINRSSCACINNNLLGMLLICLTK